MCYIQTDTDSLITQIRQSKYVNETAVYSYCATVNIGAPD